MKDKTETGKKVKTLKGKKKTGKEDRRERDRKSQARRQSSSWKSRGGRPRSKGPRRSQYIPVRGSWWRIRKIKKEESTTSLWPNQKMYASLTLDVPSQSWARCRLTLARQALWTPRSSRIIFLRRGRSMNCSNSDRAKSTLQQYRWRFQSYLEKRSRR